MATPIQRPDDDIFQNCRSYQECGEALSAYLKKASRSLSEQERMEIKLQIACCETVLGHINEGNQLLTDCEAYILEHGRPEEKALAYHTRSRLDIHFARFADGLAAGLRALYLFRELPFHGLTIATAKCCGVACSNLNLFSEAIDHLTDAQRLAREMGDNKGALLASAQLTETRMRILPAEDCIAYNKELLADIYREYGNEPSIAEAATSLHLAVLYCKVKDYTLASGYIDRALGLMQQLDYLPPYHFLYTNIYVVKTEVASAHDDEKAMLRYAQECIDRGAQINKPAPEIDASQVLFRYYLDHGDHTRAKAYLDRAASLIPGGDHGALYHELNENLCLYYAALRDSERELHHFRLIYEYNIKAQQEGLNNRVKYITSVHALELKQKEIEQHKAELEFKTQELNMTSYHLQQRTQLLNDLKDSIADLKRAKHKSDVVFKTITKAIDQAFNKEEGEKDRFRERFDEAHRGFIARLHSAYPTLSPTECRVCALLRSGFNTKDIASLLSTSPRNIENHRVAIRRKMGLTRTDNLNLVLTAID